MRVLSSVWPSFLVLCVALAASLAPAWAETRLALIITNQAYPVEIGALTNPHKDGTTIAAALAAVGFANSNIIVVKDADQPTLRLAIADLVERAEKAGPDTVVFLYYSGHGAADRTERGENYLIPVGARITLAKQLPILGVGLSEITKALERVPAKARFVVIDACRNVAFTKGLKDATKGFVPERKLDGMIVAFATRPGETADDNNVYAAALAGILPTPGLEAEQVFKETQRRVAELSKGTQIPWTEDGLIARFRFRDAVVVVPVVPKQEPIPAKRPAEPAVAILPQPAPPQPAPARPADPIAALVPGAGQSARDCTECPEMVVVPAGSFTMGSSAGEIAALAKEFPDAAQYFKWEAPQRTVKIAAPFAVGKFSVTFEEWAACVKGGGCQTTKEPSDQGWGKGRRPVINVSWDDAKEYVAWLSKKTGHTYRLLSEAEREYVTRAGTTTRFWWGASISTAQANYDGNYTIGGSPKGEYRAKTVPVDSFQPNPWGLYQVHGNVYDWVEDCWHDSYVNAPTDGLAWITLCADSNQRVLRGGSWDSLPRYLRSAFRFRFTADLRDLIFGFRVARPVVSPRTL